MRTYENQVFNKQKWTSAIIQARTTSARLPQKVLKKVLDKTILEYVIERVKKSNLVDEVIIATTTNNTDDEIVRIAGECDVGVYRGSELDVLDRYYQTAKRFCVDNIVRITSDCPLIDPQIIDLVVEKYLEEKADFTSNRFPPSKNIFGDIIKPTYPSGFDVEVINFKTLYHIWSRAKERQEPFNYLHEHYVEFKYIKVISDKDYSKLHLSVDTQEDFEKIRGIIEKLYPSNPNFTMEDVLKIL